MLRTVYLKAPRPDRDKVSLEMFVRPGTSDESICRDVIEKDTYRLAWASQFLRGKIFRDSVTVIDVGANIGAFSRLAFNLWGDSNSWTNPWPVKVFAYEPHPLNYGLLSYNLNGNNAACYMTGIYGDDLPQQYLVERGEDERSEFGGWGLCQVKHHYRPDGTNEVGVPCNLAHPKELQQIIYERSFFSRVILKLDCEACEFSILDSLSDAALSKLSLIVGEFHCHALTMDYMRNRFHFGRTANRILEHFHCDALAERPDSQDGVGDAFTFTALSRKLSTYEAGK